MDFKVIQEKWQNKWEKEKIFQVELDSKKKKYYVLEMFPYPSASFLHMGHVRNYTIGDIIARYKRMTGFNVLYPMGYDSFGLPAENAAKKAGEHPREYTEKAIAMIKKYQKALGNSYDWSKTIATHEPEYYKWNQYFFIEFYKKGLVYRKKAAVNWCPKCNTVLANEEVEAGKCWRCASVVEEKKLEQWFFKTTAYADELLEDIETLEWSDRIKSLQKNWIGKSFGTEVLFEINGEKWPIFTTRVDTIYGVTFMVVSSQHTHLMKLVTKENKKQVEEFVEKCKIAKGEDLESLDKEGVFTGSYAINPITKEKIPVWIGNFVLADYGSGMVMAVPTHDQRDFEFAKKYQIPLKVVILPSEGKFLVIEKSLLPENVQKLKNYGSVNIEKTDKDWGKFFRINVSKGKETEFIHFLENNLLTSSEDGGAWYADSMGTTNVVVFPKKYFRVVNEKDLQEFKSYGRKLGIPEKQLEIKLGVELLKEAYTEDGILVNSGEFNGTENRKAIDEITVSLENKKLGKKTVNYKLRDWLISRQRYWGTPIPMIYCDKCGAVPDEKLPVLLPEDVEFSGTGNPILTSKNFQNVKCPKCSAKARRETDTMGGFMDSSWYFLRYTDNKNNKKAFDQKNVDYWMPVDQYIGGIEHAVGHLIYSRFFTKALRDLGYLNFNEPFLRLFNQGIVNKEGSKMSKSAGNIVTQDEISEKYGIDTARIFLMFVADPESSMEWNDSSVESVYRFVKRIIALEAKEKTNDRLEHYRNKFIKEISNDIENFKFNLALIKLMKWEDILSKGCDNKSYEDFLKIFSVFAPHVSEELWFNSGKKSFISIESWPKVNEKKIDEKVEFSENLISSLIEDVNQVQKFAKIENLKKIKFVIANDWKYSFIKKFKDMIEVERNVGVLIKSLMDKEHAKEISALIPALLKNPTKVPIIVLTQKEELKIIEGSKKIFEEKFECKFEIELAEKSSEIKAGNAMPGKPAVIIA